MTRWTVNPIFDSYAIVLLMIGGLMLTLLVGPRYRRLDMHRSWILRGLRAVVILLVALALLRPAVVNTSTSPQRAVLVLLVDRSRSMQLPAAQGGGSRWDEQRELLDSIRDVLADFGEHLDLRAYAYAQNIDPLNVNQGNVELPAMPTGDETDVGTALYDAMQRELGQRVAGIVIVGDGTQTAITPRVDIQRAYRELANSDSPLYSVAFGPTGDRLQSRDVALESLPERFTVFAKNEVIVKGSFRVRGYVNKDIPVELIIDGPQGRRTLGPQTLNADKDNALVTVSIPVTPNEPGEYRLTLRAAAQPDELVTENNELTAFMSVLEGGLRVLYLYGDLTGEQRLLRRSVDASEDIQLDSTFVDRRARNTWPISIGEQIERQRYDVLLIESVDAKAFSESDLERISKRVGEGMGLIMIGGFHSFGPGGFQPSKLADVLPITMGRFEQQDLDPNLPISRDLHLWGELTLRATRNHPVTTITPGPANNELWQSLPPLQGANRFGVKPSAMVLLETTDGAPILVAGTFGRGRVLAFAGNSSGRWWQYGQQLIHRRFWRQTILWLAQREDFEKNDVWVQLEQRRFARGAPIDFTAGILDALGEPVNPVKLVAERVDKNGQQLSVALSADGDQYRGVVPPPNAPGDYVLRITATQQERLLGTARVSFQVMDQDIEMSNPSADYDQMSRLAAATKEAGGRPVAAEELPDVLRELHKENQAQRVEVQAKWQLGDTAWDAWLLFLAILGVVTSEWVLRKRWGLV